MAGTQNDNKTARPLYVDCDSKKISQMVFNLVDDAMKFTLNGKIYVSITTADVSDPQFAVTNGCSTGTPKDITTGESKPPPPPQPDGDLEDTINSVLVMVSDTGEGISNQIKDQLFEKFATKSRQGTGLGLYLSTKIIESHGGHIWYEEPIREHGKDAKAYGFGNSDK